MALEHISLFFHLIMFNWLTGLELFFLLLEEVIFSRIVIHKTDSHCGAHILTLSILMDFPMHIDTISMGLFLCVL